jgi:hypothetical protein
MTWAMYMSVEETPVCHVHGPMKARSAIGSDMSCEGDMAVVQAVQYVCVGFDGEGCDNKSQIEYQFIGWANDIDFGS